MQFKITIVLLALCAFASGSHLPPSAQKYFAKFVFESRATIEDNPTRSIVCFGDYMDEITEITNVYEEEFGKCFSTSEDALTALDQSFAKNRCEITRLSASACQLFTDCNVKKSSLEFFTCYTSAGNDASRTFYSIANNADQFTKDISQKQTLIIFEKDQCNAVCKAKYEKSADASWTTLQNCINAPST